MLQLFQNKRSRGFTLIELLVVIAIIGLLASIVLVSVNNVRTKARDTKRISDLKQISLALEMYYDSNGKYPPETCAGSWASVWNRVIQQLVDANLLSAIPGDPITNYYLYACPGPNDQTYLLGAQLETDHPALQNDTNSCPTWVAWKQCSDAQKMYCLGNRIYAC